MPKRTNDFQKLIYIIENVLNQDNAKVIESAEVIDKDTGNIREVDILIESLIGTHKIKIGIECVARNRPTDVKWIEEMSKKHESLGTNKLILVSKLGFTKAAIEKASKLNIEIHTLENAEKIDWTAKVHTIPSLKVYNFIYDIFTTKVVPKEKENILKYEKLDLGNSILYNHKDEEIGLIKNYGHILFENAELNNDVMEKIDENLSYTLDLSVKFNYPNYIFDNEYKKIELLGIMVTYNIKKIVSPMTIEKQFYGETPITYGYANCLGHKMNITLVQKSDEEIYITGGITKEKKLDEFYTKN